MMIKFLIISAVIVLTSCGQRTQGYYNKHQEPTYIKIDSFDIMGNELNLRIEYRSYKEKSLAHINCTIRLNNDSIIELNKQENIALSSYSTEILSFKNLHVSQSKTLFNQKAIDYNISCQLDFEKGHEFTKNQSVLHLVPASKHKYR